MKVEYLSASRSDVFVGCPFRYFLQYHLQLPELKKDTIQTTKGSAAHLALEHHALGKSSVDALKSYYAENQPWKLDNRRPDKGWPHPVEKKCDGCKWAINNGTGTICSIASRSIDDFEGCPKPNFEDDLKLVNYAIDRKDSPFNRKIVGVETPFDMELGGFRVHGYIDLLTEFDENTLEVRDYKTGVKGKNTEEMFKDLQMRIYSVAAKKLFPQYKYVEMTLDFLRTRPVTVIFGPDDDKKTIEVLREIHQKITNSIDPPRKKSFKCSWCVGYERCGQIREQFVKDGVFVMPPPVEKPKIEKEEETA